MYDEYDDYLDELLEEAYLEGYYDSLDDMDDYYTERKSTIHPAYLPDIRNPNEKVLDSKMCPQGYKIFKKLEDKYYKDRDTMGKYYDAYYDKLVQNKLKAYSDRRKKDARYLNSKGIRNSYILSRDQQHRRPVNMDKYR